MNSDGYAYIGVYRWLPYWALELARIYLNHGRLYFEFQLRQGVVVEIYWPDEEVQENWYL